ncbi:MAG: hypothetical protein FWC67_01840 [Defluviitaleaceae bacterium]|nr:hypothetical protein [Defluviitaleaceae bacterium]
MKNGIKNILKAGLMLGCAAMIMAACGSSGENDAHAQFDEHAGNSGQVAQMDAAAQMPQMLQQEAEPEPEIAPIAAYTNEYIVLQYQNRNDEILRDIWGLIAQFESYFSSIYIPIPHGISAQEDSARDVVRGMAEAYVIGEVLGNIATAADVIGALFNAGERASAVMSAHVVEGVIPFTTVLNYIYQKGYVAAADLVLAQDAFGNFMQRVGAVHGTGANAQRYLRAHNQMLDYYSEFYANIYIIGFIESLPSGANSPDITAVSDDIAYALNDYETEFFLNNAHRRISAFPLNFDETRARDIERTYGLGGAFLSALPFFGLFDNSQGVDTAINETARFVFGNLTRANDFATDNINPQIARLNIIQQTISQRANLLRNVLDNPQYYTYIFAALSAMPQAQRAQLLSFDDLLDEFVINAHMANNAIGLARELLGIALTPAEHDRHSQQLLDIGLRIASNNRGVIFGHIAMHEINNSRLNMRLVGNMHPDLQERMEQADNQIHLEAAWLRYDIVMDMRFRQANTNMNTTSRALSQGRYYIETTRNGVMGQVVMIREFENTGTLFRTNHEPRWTTLYSSGWSPTIIFDYLANEVVVIGAGVLYATDNWYAQIEAAGSVWDWHIYEALVDLAEQPRMNAADYISNLRIRTQNN